MWCLWMAVTGFRAKQRGKSWWIILQCTREGKWISVCNLYVHMTNQWHGSFKCIWDFFLFCSKIHTHTSQWNQEKWAWHYCTRPAESRERPLPVHHYAYTYTAWLKHFHSRSDLANPVKANLYTFRNMIESLLLQNKKQKYHIVVRPHMSKKQNSHPAGKHNILLTQLKILLKNPTK